MFPVEPYYTSFIHKFYVVRGVSYSLLLLSHKTIQYQGGSQVNAKQVIKELNKVPRTPGPSNFNTALSEAIKSVDTLDRIRKVVNDPEHITDILHSIMTILMEES